MANNPLAFVKASFIMQWYYSNNGAQTGPVSAEDLKSMLADGRVKSTDMVWREGMSDWVPASSVGELAVSAAPAPVQAAPLLGAAAAPYQPPVTAQPMGQAYHGDIPTYLWQSIAVTLLCCLPGGIVAIVYASKVDGLKTSGNIPAAQAASKSAKTWCFASFGIGLVVTVLYIVLNVLVVASSSSSGY